jgi:ribonuclease D
MGDLAVLSIAESKPKTVEQLRETRGVDRGVVRDHGDDIVKAVTAALDSEPSTWPRHPTPPSPELAAVQDALGLAARMVAHDADVATWLAYERDDLAALCDQPPRGRITEGWRAGVLAPPLLELLNGRAALTVSGRRLRLKREDEVHPVGEDQVADHAGHDAAGP